MMISALKYIIGIAGIAFAIAYFILGIYNGDKRSLKKSVIFFSFTWVLIIFITMLEFFYYYIVYH